MTIVRAYGIVRSDLSGDDTELDAARVRDLSGRHGFDLCAVRIEHGDDDFGLLLATLAPSHITVLIVPTVAHVTGWLDAVRQDASVWTVRPAGCWPRLDAPGAAAEFVPAGSA
ncbi:hypothetical protein IRT45_32335 [Nocardia sp. BSTN01]|uniref:hypothetical protein n=1 Tax=Nocardia sp. BSTN01 TaxID=2783665 RepID=UPI00188DF4FE|nr:hypothetical protein [Nocardia sp. BSTN01]MBF5001818.1 hypothetical protein [Nocardia sp. BSTN01]